MESNGETWLFWTEPIVACGLDEHSKQEPVWVKTPLIETYGRERRKCLCFSFLRVFSVMRYTRDGMSWGKYVYGLVFFLFPLASCLVSFSLSLSLLLIGIMSLLHQETDSKFLVPSLFLFWPQINRFIVVSRRNGKLYQNMLTDKKTDFLMFFFLGKTILIRTI